MNEKKQSFTSHDGTKLVYRSWTPQGTADRAVIIFHRGHEHSGRVAELVQDLQLAECAFFAWDQRGCGESPGERGYAEEFYDLVRDIESFVRHVQEQHGFREDQIVVLGHSVAAVLVSLWVHDYAPRIRGMILATPAFKVKLYVPFAIPALRIGNWFARRFLGKKTLFVQSYVKGKALTHDPEQAKRYNEDALISKQIAVNILLGLFDGSKRLVADAGAIMLPTLLLSARADWVVKNKPQRDFFNALSSSFKRVKVYQGFFHSIFHEKERELPISACREFINEVFERSTDYTVLREADRQGYTSEEYAWLSARLPMISAKRLWYLSQKLAGKTLGMLSDGIRIGWKTGFDSGQSLNYVYKNQASGALGVGALIDRGYLDAIGWKGIRVRKVHLEAMLDRAVRDVRESELSDSIRIVDVAGGPGRYLIDFSLAHPEVPLDILVRDWSEEGLEEGRQLAAESGCKNVRHERADAFSLEDLSKIAPGVSIGVVSGLYELFPGNEMVRRSLQGISGFVKPGGYLVYTGQPWHPQLETIAETLINRDGEPWIMRRRTQAEMDELVSEAGFKKCGMLVDNWGIFTVSLARRE